jgi:ParB family chromosome partitioning protein
MNKKRGLGRGLDALLGGPEPLTPPARHDSEMLRTLDIDQVQRGRYQPRTDMQEDALEDLAASIRSQGIVQPIVVRPLGTPGRYEIIAGERRWRAAQMAGLQQVPVLVRDVDDHTAMSIALIENIQRAQLNPIEEANGIARLIGEFAMTHQLVAEAIGRSRASVTNLLRLLELEPTVKRMLEHGEMEMGHARALLALAPEQQLATAHKIVEHRLSVRQAEQLVKHIKAGKPERPSKAQANPDLVVLERDLAEKLGCKVCIKHTKKGGGTLTIQYHSLDELDGVLAHLK